MAQKKTEELDLGIFFRSFDNFFKQVIRKCFEVLAFFKKRIIWILIIAILGFAYGYYKDSEAVKTYHSELILIPNFESVDYLYGKVGALNSKIQLRDSVFLEKILDANYRKLRFVEIEPISDVFNFVSKSRENVDIFKILSMNQNLEEYVEDLTNSKYFKYHRMKVGAEGKQASEEITSNLMQYFNDNEHFLSYKNVFVENNKLQIAEHYRMVAQIDSMIHSSIEVSKTNQSVYISDNSGQHNLIERKKLLLENLLILKMESKDYDSPIKLVSANFNLYEKKFLSISNKIKYPIVFIFVFSLFFFIKYSFNYLEKMGGPLKEA